MISAANVSIIIDRCWNVVIVCVLLIRVVVVVLSDIVQDKSTETLDGAALLCGFHQVVCLL